MRLFKLVAGLTYGLQNVIVVRAQADYREVSTPPYDAERSSSDTTNYNCLLRPRYLNNEETTTDTQGCKGNHLTISQDNANITMYPLSDVVDNPDKRRRRTQRY